ncbi:Thiol:disulfide interchange protein [hydrothermal vent metagenome]|uniref:Thiol:disulfide interchange protein n=1 Tax=hydrothermal vent metagenome TaxID=652676 RepID=A0A3B0TG96_9ZZZZ
MTFKCYGLFLSSIYTYICELKNRSMKKIILSLSIILTVIACDQKPEGYTIQGHLRGDVENGTKVYLRKQGENRQPVDIDTVTMENGVFTFKGEAGVPELHYIFIDKLQGYTVIVLENGEIELNAQKDSLGLAEIAGTPQNDFFANYIKQSQKISKRGMSIQKDLQKANIAKDEATIASLGDEMKDLQEEYKNFELSYIKEHPNALISVLLLDKAIASRQVPYEEVQGMYDAITPEMKETGIANKVSEQLQGLKEREEKGKSTEVGAKAPDFTAPGVDGQPLALADMMGKVTLVDFWAAWCRPCRAENPNVVAVYKKYHDKGLSVIGVSLDKKAEDWKKAIKDDGLTWNHVSHVQYFNDPIAKLYNVDAIPAAFLLDENGIIVAKNLRGAELEEKIAELLN